MYLDRALRGDLPRLSDLPGIQNKGKESPGESVMSSVGRSDNEAVEEKRWYDSFWFWLLAAALSASAIVCIWLWVAIL